MRARIAAPRRPGPRLDSDRQCDRRRRADRLVVVDPHTPALEAQCPIPVEILTAVPTLSGELAPGLPDGSVVVAPDLGAVKLAERYAGVLHCPVAVVRKQRENGAR